MSTTITTSTGQLRRAPTGFGVDPVGAVESMREQIRAECAGIDHSRALPATLITGLRELGVFRLLAPAEIGGAELDPLTFWRLVEATSHAEGSVGWCVGLGGGYSAFAGMLPAEVAQLIYGDPNTISAGNFAPNAIAEEVPGGYRVSGRWPLGSGSSHATWFLGGAVVSTAGHPVAGPGGGPLIREVFIPASDVEIIDTWDSTGLRGTASHDYAVREVFVPHTHTTWFADPPTRDQALYRMPPVAMFATFLGAVPLGIARHALEEFITLATTKTPVLSATLLADKPSAQDRAGRAHALIAAGRHYLIDTLAELWDRVNAGEQPSLADGGELWLAATHAAHNALHAIELLYTGAGASAIYRTNPLDRCLRDTRTAVQHIVLQHANYELAGRRLLRRPLIPSPWAMDYRTPDTGCPT